jgi:putative peptidoglycan lipid II flippase
LNQNQPQPVSEKSKVTVAAGIVGAATFLSRIFGFIRDMVIASVFGAGLSADAFFVAFRIPNLLRRLFAEGSLSITFVPVFSEYLTNFGKNEAFKLALSAVRTLSVLLILVAFTGVLLSPLIVRLIAPGFSATPGKLALTITLTRMMFPYIFFIGLVALFMGILNVLGHFAAPALAPVCLNIAMIGSVFLIAPFMSDPIFGVAVGVIIGGILQLLLQVPFLIKKGFIFWKKASFYHPGLKKIGTLMLPTILGAAVYQINILVGTLLASLLPQGSVSYLYYADRLVQFPLGIFAIAIATAVLPTLSRQAAAKDTDALRETFAYAIRLVLFITVPAMIGLIVLREPIVALLFKRGAFDAETVRQTAVALLYYCVGLWAFSAVRVVVSTFYALQDTRTPVRMAIIAIAANIVFSIILMKPLAHGGLALATSLSSILNLVLLICVLKKRLGVSDWRPIVISGIKTVASSAIMGVGVYIIAYYTISSPTAIPFTHLSAGLSLSIVCGLILYAGLSLLMKSGELKTVTAIIQSRLHR